VEKDCQMTYFQTKNPNFGNFWRVLQWKMLVYFIAFWSNLRPFGIIFAHLVYFVAIWYVLLPFGGIFYGYLVYFSRFGMLYQEKSGNPDVERSLA
jgi:hypothetical protein